MRALKQLAMNVFLLNHKHACQPDNAIIADEMRASHWDLPVPGALYGVPARHTARDFEAPDASTCFKPSKRHRDSPGCIQEPHRQLFSNRWCHERAYSTWMRCLLLTPALSRARERGQRQKAAEQAIRE
ncbi:hypothetical protein [Ottowia thiooxydans]|uniref:hypothetical protein n=1 Tax=Ottowia thiooxydans TaxID=219182 RepID=UPI0012EC1F83|nr:hypothetical protein [Ottowia thiooxydans]